MGTPRTRTRWSGGSALGLLVLAGFTVAALVGYGTFGRNSAMLAANPDAAWFYAISFRFFAQVQIALAFLALAVFLTAAVGGRWLLPFALVYAVSLGSELLGTTYGVPFGAYSYTDALGAQVAGRVPYLIPLSWFFMAVPAYVIAGRTTLGRSPIGRIAIGSFILAAWDLALDPAMSHATAYWVWAEEGAYYGMPWLNLFGWYVTGIALMGVLAATERRSGLLGADARWLGGFYAVNLALPVGMSALAGLWGAVAATLLALAAVGAVSRRRDPTVAAAPLRTELAS